MRELEYPLDGEWIIKKKRKLKRILTKELEGVKCIKTKIAILGGSTTSDIKDCLELFLLHEGIVPSFYESEYNRFFEEAVFENYELEQFNPDIIYIHTSNRNINEWPVIRDNEAVVADKLEKEYQRFELVWEVLREKYNCTIIQNNMEMPFYRIMGNIEANDYRGRVNFVERLNMKFYDYANRHDEFFINDIHYLSANYGLDKWAEPYYWYMFKYCLSVEAIPYLAKNISHIIKSLYGKNKKALALDLDNTLWGGVIGEDGVENILVGQESSTGQAYLEFQQVIKKYKDMGILLNISSKNDEEIALEGLKRSDGVLKEEDFLVIKANWEPKSKNILEIASELNIMPDSIVFIDDNPAEREILRQQASKVVVPEISRVENYIKEIDGNGYFEVTKLSEDDINRNMMYKANVERENQVLKYSDYKEYLLSLEMSASIKPFSFNEISRIVQLVNKSNQFNVTTRRYTQNEIANVMENAEYVTLYGRLKDKFGDNGIVTLFIGRIEERIMHIDLWLMSCRVLKRDLEKAMLDRVILECQDREILEIRGYYYPTAKNSMVKLFYEECGFEKIKEDSEGNSEWKWDMNCVYESQNSVIKMED